MKSKLLLFALLTGLVTKAAPPADEGKADLTRCADCQDISHMLLGTNNQYLVVYAGLLALLFASLLFAYKVKKYKREVFNGK
jgi:hypothetical protein